MWLTLIKVFLYVPLVFLENKYQEPWRIKNPEEALPWHLTCLFCDVQSSEDRGLFPLKNKVKLEHSQQKLVSSDLNVLIIC